MRFVGTPSVPAQVLVWGRRHSPGMHRPTRTSATVLVAFGVTVPLATINLLLAVFNILVRPTLSDFRHYFLAAQIGLQHGWSHIYDLSLQRPLFRAEFPGWDFQPFANPPPMAWLASPFTALPYRPAAYLWAALMIACLVVASQLIATGGRLSRVAYFAAVGVFPAMLGISVANVAAAVALAVVAAWWLLQRDHQVLAGIVLGAMVLKPHLGLLLPLALVFCGRWRTVVSAGLVASALAALSLISLGSAGLHQYMEVLTFVGNLKNQHTLTVISVVGSGPASLILELAMGMTALAAAWLNRKQGLEFPMAAALIGSLLVTRYLNTGDLIMVVLAVWLISRMDIPVAVRLVIGGTWMATNFANVAVLPQLTLEVGLLVALIVLALRRVTTTLPLPVRASAA